MDQTLPSDPMWATFRREHPEVTLVLLPPVAPPDLSDTEAPAPVMTTADDAPLVLDTLVRRVSLILEVLHLDAPDLDVAPHRGWRRIGNQVVQAQVSVRASATESTPSDREIIAIRLAQLGWTPEQRPDSEVVWIDAAAGELFVRVTVFDGIVSVRASGPRLTVGDEAATALVASVEGASANDD